MMVMEVVVGVMVVNITSKDLQSVKVIMMAKIELPLVETTTTGDSGLAESRWLRAAWRSRARLAARVAPEIVTNVSLGNRNKRVVKGNLCYCDHAITTFTDVSS